MINSPREHKADHQRKMQAYYQFQSRIYDATRWSFLFGRRRMVNEFPFAVDAPINILEVGCGTGANLMVMAKRFPNAQIVGIDVSADMLKIAAKKTQAHHQRISLLTGYYGQLSLHTAPDIIIFSYCLTMVNPGWAQLIEQAYADLKPGGCISVVDFHESKVAFFKRHMSKHHVRMEGHLLPQLNQHFQPLTEWVSNAYFGIWTYLNYLGVKED